MTPNLTARGAHSPNCSTERGLSLRKSLALLIGGSILISVSACSSPQMIGRPDLTIVENTELPPPAEVDLQTIKRPAIIGPGDELAVDVFGLPEASRAVRVDAAGKIAVPLAGTVEASDRTAEELAGVIAGQLRAHSVRDPQVTVNVINSLSQAVTVDGAVKTPGQFAITGRTTLMRAIARGGGVTEFAQTNHVVVFRRVNEQDMAALYDLRAIRLGMYPDPEIYANDIVLVGESQSKRLFQNLMQASGILTAPLIALVQR